MPASAKLFSVVDIIAVTTGILIDKSRRGNIKELARHVADLPSMPKRGTDARAALAAAVQMQLPDALRRFDQLALMALIIELKTESVTEDEIRAKACTFLERRFGRELPLVSEELYYTDLDSLAHLRAIAGDPTALPPMSTSAGQDSRRP